MKRTFDVIVKGGTIVVTERDAAGEGGIIAAGSPSGVAKELKAIFEDMKETAEADAVLLRQRKSA
jgi:hypothetical protein